MRPAKLILLGLVGASLAACERPAARSAEAEPQNLPRLASPAPNTKVAAATTAATPAAKPREAPAPAPEAISDAFITGSVRAAVMGDPGLAGADVSVNTNHGVVSLTGHVKNAEQAAIAAAHAEGEDGVMRVDNTLVVMND